MDRFTRQTKIKQIKHIARRCNHRVRSTSSERAIVAAPLSDQRTLVSGRWSVVPRLSVRLSRAYDLLKIEMT